MEVHAAGAALARGRSSGRFRLNARADELCAHEEVSCSIRLRARRLRFTSAQTVHEYASVEYSPAIRKMGVFSTSMPSKVVDMKPIHMDKSELDIITFFNEVQDMEKQGWGGEQPGDRGARERAHVRVDPSETETEARCDHEHNCRSRPRTSKVPYSANSCVAQKPKRTSVARHASI